MATSILFLFLLPKVTMKLYQLYFLVLKFIVVAHIALVSLGFTIADSPLFTLIDSVFKVSIGLFLMVYFWFFRPKGLDWEDSAIISVAGLVILMEIKFAPILHAFQVQDQLLKAVKTNSGF